MRILGTIFTTSLLIISYPAFAFQEQKTGDMSMPNKSQLRPDNKSLLPKMEISRDKSVNTPEGTEVFIPGLGKLGMLPKMDFGLELLYGAKDEKLPTQPVDDLNSSDNLSIRGSLKHNF